MKKVALCVVVCLVSVLMLSALAEAKDVKITALVPLLKFKDNGQQEILDKVKELTGIEIELLIPEEFNEEKVKLALVAGDIPDIISTGGNLYSELAAEGLLIDLKPMIDNSKYVKDAVPQSMLDAVTRDGKIYGMPTSNPGGCVGYYRKDWLDKLGLEVPTTYEELVEVMRAFTFNDPDGDGKDNTYGYTSLVNNDFDNYNRLVFQDAVIAFKPNADGVWVDGFLEPEMADALERLKSLYDEGLIDPQFITASKTSEARSKLIEGKVGIFEYWAGEWGMNLDEYTKKVDPNNEIAAMPPLEGMQYKVRQPGVWAITIKAKDPQLIFDQLFEGFFDKGERQVLWTYGVEGMHWVKEDGGRYLPTKVDPTREFKKAWIPRELQLNDMDYLVPLDPRVEASMATFTPTWQEQIPPTSKTYVKYYGDLLNVKKEIVLKIVVGDYTIEEGLKLYEEQAMGEFKLATILEELNAK